jgi:hypothetical protein
MLRSQFGTLLPQADAAVRPELAEADVRPLEHPLVNRLKLA